jgi:hypothetical protein
MDEIVATIVVAIIAWLLFLVPLKEAQRGKKWN